MSRERPTSVNVVSWFFIIIGTLSAISAIGYIVVGNINGGSILDSWPGLVQVVIVCALVFTGSRLLNGSEQARKVLLFSSFLLVVMFIGYSFWLYRKFESLGPLLNLIIYLIPMFFVIKALRSKKIETYTSKES